MLPLPLTERYIGPLDGRQEQKEHRKSQAIFLKISFFTSDSIFILLAPDDILSLMNFYRVEEKIRMVSKMAASREIGKSKIR